MIDKKYSFLVILISILILCLFASFMYMNSRLSTIELSFNKLPNPSATVEQEIPADYRSLIDGYLQKNMEKIVKKEHPIGGKWIITKRIFLSANTIVLYYEDGHELGKLVLVIDEIIGDKIRYRILWQ